MEKNEKTNLINITEFKNHNGNLKKETNEIESRQSINTNHNNRYYIFDNFKGILIFIFYYIILIII